MNHLIQSFSRLVLCVTALATASLVGCGGGGSDSTVGGTTTPVAVLPGAPTIGAAAAGDGSASVAFTAPTSSGSAAITSYTVTCNAGTTSAIGTGNASPVTVSGMLNGASYSCNVAATSSAGMGASSNSVSVTPVAPVVNTAPGAPTIGTATAGDGSISVAFTAPSATGGSAITSYTASCTAAGATVSAKGAASPLLITGLVNGRAYSCVVIATNSAGNSVASAAVSATPAASVPVGTTTDTSSILCTLSHDAYNSSASVKLNSTYSWTCDSTYRQMTANGVPDHEVGTFPNPNNPPAIAAHTTQNAFPVKPANTGVANAVAHVTGFGINGVKFDPSTAGTCNSAGTCVGINGTDAWNIEALGQTSFNFGTDFNHAHVQPDGAYHYHGIPEGIVTNLGKGTGMALVGWAMDGFPVYARYAYSVATDASSSTKVMTASYRLKSSPDSGRPAVTMYPMGTFTQDYEYVANLGDLDECNGRTGVTPEFPKGTYYYMETDTWPYIQRCVKGTIPAPVGPPPN